MFKEKKEGFSDGKVENDKTRVRLKAVKAVRNCSDQRLRVSEMEGKVEEIGLGQALERFSKTVPDFM